jgi:predicted dienelactone hydrolase
LLDHVISEYDVDVDRIGGAGFSFGGYTVAALLGARVDSQVMDAIVQGHIPAPDVPEFPDMIAALRARYSHADLSSQVQSGSVSLADRRVRAGVLLAPAIGRLLVPESLAQINAPVLVRWGDADDNTPPEDNAHVYRDLIPQAEGTSVGVDVGHYVFLGDRDDPTNVRKQVAQDTLAFFSENL